MEVSLLIILIIYSVGGGIIMAFVNKNKDVRFQRNNWIKYFVYLLIMALLFGTILIKAIYFHYFGVLILLLGLFEITKLIVSKRKVKLGIITMLLFFALAILFFQFSMMPAEYLFYTLFLTTVFDAYSQLTGQLFGRKKLFKNISPNKTFEGLLGGYIVTLLSAVFIHNQLQISVVKSVLIAVILATFSMIGDLLASYCKRKFEVKDFSRILPGHGGILDRFDSLLASGTSMFLMYSIFNV